MKTTSTVSLITAIVVLMSSDSTAHICGPSSLTLTVGQTCPWRITADRTETVSQYQVSLAGAAGVVRVGPTSSGTFSAHHGDFLFTGLAPGTNTLSVKWSYAPTQASATCTVQVVVQAAPAGQTTNVGRGRLSGASRLGIPARTVGRMIQQFVPASSKKLIVFAQCFAGNAALDPAIRSLPNTSVLSATAPGVEARYGGYHDDAASALRPGTGRTAADVHLAGSVGRHALGLNDQGREFDKATIASSSEWPLITGTMSPTMFSLESTSANGNVQSRHIVFYAGLPSTRTPRLATIDGHTVPSHFTGQSTSITDTADATTLTMNFANQLNTTIETVGGAPSDADRRLSSDSDYMYAGNLDGLQAAIKAAGQAIASSPDPSKEQFILFVGDHGELATGTFPVTPTTLAGRASLRSQSVANASSAEVTLDGFETFASDSPIVERMLSEPANRPGFSVLVEFPSDPAIVTGALGQVRSVFGDQGLEVRLQNVDEGGPNGAQSRLLTVFTEQVFDVDEDGVVGSTEGEAVQLFFEIPEREFLRTMLDSELSITLVNHSSHELLIREVVQVSGLIERVSEFDPNLPPRLADVRMVGEGQHSVVLHGGRGLTYQIQTSPDLNDWSTWANVTVGDHPPEVIGNASPSVEQVFLRAVGDSTGQ